MELKTKIKAEDNIQELIITRSFDIAVDLLYKAHTDPQIVEQWMGTKVIKLDTQKHGSWQYITTDPMGNQHGFNGVFHDLVANQSIIRTFEMENSGFGPQLEFLEFEQTGPHSSLLTMHIIFKSVEVRNALLKLPFAQGINMAHNRLQEIILKSIK